MKVSEYTFKKLQVFVTLINADGSDNKYINKDWEIKDGCLYCEEELKLEDIENIDDIIEPILDFESDIVLKIRVQKIGVIYENEEE